MHVAILTFQGFNELDSLVATVQAQSLLDAARAANALQKISPYLPR